MTRDKDQLRAEMKAVRAGMTQDRLDACARGLVEQVLALPMLSVPTSVCCYVSIKRELPTRELLSALLARGHRLSVPHVLGAGRLEARVVPDEAALRALAPAVLGIPTSEGVAAEDVAVALCPGLAFDLSGGRLGYGAGHYDRWLAANPSVLPVGLSYDETLLEKIPQGAHDVPMSLLLTPTRTLRAAQQAPRTRVVGAAWIRRGKLLAAQRGPHKARPLLWELPGGKLEPGESDRDALAREMREELSADVHVGALVGETRSEEPSALVDLAIYEVRSDDDPKQTEHAALRWLSADELDSVPWAPADRPFLAPLRARLR